MAGKQHNCVIPQHATMIRLTCKHCSLSLQGSGQPTALLRVIVKLYACRQLALSCMISDCWLCLTQPQPSCCGSAACTACTACSRPNTELIPTTLLDEMLQGGLLTSSVTSSSLLYTKVICATTIRSCPCNYRLSSCLWQATWCFGVQAFGTDRQEPSQYWPAGGQCGSRGCLPDDWGSRYWGSSSGGYHSPGGRHGSPHDGFNWR